MGVYADASILCQCVAIYLLLNYTKYCKIQEEKKKKKKRWRQSPRFSLLAILQTHANFIFFYVIKGGIICTLFTAMATKKSVASSHEDILTSILDPKVIELLGRTLAPIIAQSIEANLTKRIEELTVTVNKLKETNDVLTKKQQNHEQDMLALRKRLNETEGRLEDVEIYSRAHDIIIRGLPENSYAERATLASNSATATTETSTVLEDAIIQLCQVNLGVQVDRRDISVAHRLKASPHDRSRPVIVRFTSRRIRDQVFRSKRELKALLRDKAIFISEHLTRASSTLFFEARKRLRDNVIAAAWTMNGLVHIKTTTNASERPTIIRSLADLEAHLVRPAPTARP
jgi:hypothetical protein